VPSPMRTECATGEQQPMNARSIAFATAIASCTSILVAGCSAAADPTEPEGSSSEAMQKVGGGLGGEPGGPPGTNENCAQQGWNLNDAVEYDLYALQCQYPRATWGVFRNGTPAYWFEAICPTNTTATIWCNGVQLPNAGISQVITCYANTGYDTSFESSGICQAPGASQAVVSWDPNCGASCKAPKV
jgi:hypothetical protein